MPFHFHFTGLERRKDLNDLINFLIKQDLGYPNYNDWVQRTKYELDSGYKQVILALSGKRLVGNLIYQPHKEISSFLELKNLRVHPQLRERKFAEFMLRQAEFENKNKYDAIIGDLPANLYGTLRFMKEQGYKALTPIPLYDKNRADITVIKFLNKEKEKSILLNANKIIYKKAV